MSTSAQLDGNEPSWYNEETNCDHYTTNFGMVEINRDTGEVGDVNIGIGRNQGNTQMSIFIYDNEFKVTKDTFNTIYAVYNSEHAIYPYTGTAKQTIEVSDILRVLQRDDNYSVAAVAAKKKFVKLLLKSYKFSKQEAYDLHLLLVVWRKPITKQDLINRTAIVTRTPILTQ